MSGAATSPSLSGSLRRLLAGSFSSPLDAALTLLLVGAAAYALAPLMRWLVADAVFAGSSAQDCVGRDGACWIFVKLRAEQILFGSYPMAERWRVLAAGALGLAWSRLSPCRAANIGGVWRRSSCRSTRSSRDFC
jgi:general L-amino acid transport system permease protein